MIKLVIFTEAGELASFAVSVVCADPLWRTDLLPLHAQADGLRCTGHSYLLLALQLNFLTCISLLFV